VLSLYLNYKINVILPLYKGKFTDINSTIYYYPPEDML